MSRTMRAFTMTGWARPAEIREVPVPEPGPGQVVVRIAGCGLCHSGIGMMTMPQQVGESLGWAMPFTLGHEISGHVYGLIGVRIHPGGSGATGHRGGVRYRAAGAGGHDLHVGGGSVGAAAGETG